MKHSVLRLIPVVLLAVVLTIPAWCLAQPFHAVSRLVQDSVTFTGRELLTCPTATTVTVTMCADRELEVYVEHGTRSGSHAVQTVPALHPASVPFSIVVEGLSANTEYVYRVRYRTPGAPSFAARPEYRFHTARPRGSRYTFGIEADPHLDAATLPAMYRRTLANILHDSPDFLIDMGDTFMTEKMAGVTRDSVLKRAMLLRTCFDSTCHSVPLFLVQGNHDGELGWLVKGTADELPVWATLTRKAWYPMPEPGAFYSGDTTVTRYVGRRQAYYSWEWGSALFIVLDPYWNTVRKPGASKDIWDFTLGRTQYEWLKRTLETSTATLKFVFCHQVLGGVDTEGRGGIEAAPYHEMGGLNADGSQGFAARRPGWAKPIHALLVDNHVQVFFHGHDHVYVKQDLDGVVYHLLPQPGYYNYNNPERTYSTTSQATNSSYTHGTVVSSPGYVRVTVMDTTATVEYVRTYLPEHENAQRRNGDIGHQYTVSTSGVTTSASTPAAVPAAATLHQNHPNPFSAVTTIRADLASAGHVRLEVIDILGRTMTVLQDGVMSPGGHIWSFNGAGHPPGVYLCRLTVDGAPQVQRMILQHPSRTR